MSIEFIIVLWTAFAVIFTEMRIIIRHNKDMEIEKELKKYEPAILNCGPIVFSTLTGETYRCCWDRVEVLSKAISTLKEADPITIEEYLDYCGIENQEDESV